MSNSPNDLGEVPVVSRYNVYKTSPKADPDSGRPQLDHYVRHDVIGKGRHGKVWLCYKIDPKYSEDDSKRRTPVAIKEVPRISKDPADKYKLMKQNATRPLPTTGHTPLSDKLSPSEEKIRREIAIMKKCHHPHVVRLLEVIDDRMQKSVYMVMEYLAGGEVLWRNSSNQPILTVSQTKRIMRDIILGLEYLHYQGIVHRDLKPANLLWSEDRGHVKIADFGVAHFSYARQSDIKTKFGDEAAEVPLFNDDSELSKLVGTPSFIAPEIVWTARHEDTGSANDQDHPKISKAIDLWALGITFYCLLFGDVPFTADGEHQLWVVIRNDDWSAADTMGLDAVLTGGRRPEDESSEGGVVMHILDHLLTKDPRERITLEELKAHTWFLSDLPDPERWAQDTSPETSAPAKIEVDDAETSKAVSTVRFNWRWPAIKIRGMLHSVTPYRSPFRSDDDSRSVVKSFNSIKSHKSTPALPPSSTRETRKSRAQLLAQESSRRSSTSTFQLVVSELEAKRRRNSKSRQGSGTSSPKSTISPTSERAKRSFLRPWIFSKSSSTVSSPTAEVSAPPFSDVSAAAKVASVRRSHTVSSRPARPSAMGKTGKSEEILSHKITEPDENALTAAKRASSWGDDPVPAEDFEPHRFSSEDDFYRDSQTRSIRVGGRSDAPGPSSSAIPGSTPLSGLNTMDSESSYQDGEERWVSRVNGSSSHLETRTDSDDEPLSFSPSRKIMDNDAS